MLLPTIDSLAWFLAVYIGPAVTALGLTLLIELAVALAMGWRTRNDLWALKKDSRKTVLLAAAMNTASFAAGLVVLVGV